MADPDFMNDTTKADSVVAKKQAVDDLFHSGKFRHVKWIVGPQPPDFPPPFTILPPEINGEDFTWKKSLERFVDAFVDNRGYISIVNKEAIPFDADLQFLLKVKFYERGFSTVFRRVRFGNGTELYQFGGASIPPTPKNDVPVVIEKV